MQSDCNNETSLSFIIEGRYLKAYSNTDGHGDIITNVVGNDLLRIFGAGMGCFVFYVDSGFVRFLDFVPNE